MDLKCGEIYLSTSNDFILICGLCGERYHQMDTFGDHIVENHPSSEKGSAANENIKEAAQRESIVVELAETLEFGTSSILSIEQVSTADYSDDDEANGVTDGKNTFQSSDESDSADKGLSDSQCPKDRKADPRLFCNICLKQYFVLKDFFEHYIKQHGGGFICQYCDMGLNSQESLESHRKKHNLLSPYTCLHCYKTFTTKRVRQHHIKVIHMGQKPFKCTHCPMSFGTGSKLRVHMLTHSFPGVFQCEICGRQFIHESRKKTHMLTHTGEKPFICELCGKGFTLQSRLTDHYKRHNNTKNYECNLCDKRFYSNMQLKNHLVVHSNEKPFECSDCGKSFARKKTLIMHQKIHSDIKQYSCDICGKEFSQIAGLYSHKKTHGKRIGT